MTLLPGASAPQLASGCRGNAINASGFIVGSCPATAVDTYCGLIVGNCSATAFFYNGTTTIDLNSLVQSTDPLKPYVTLTDARGINDSGLVVVNGVDSRDKLGHAYLLQASSTSSSSGSSSGGSSKGGGAFDFGTLLCLTALMALQKRLPARVEPRRNRVSADEQKYWFRAKRYG